MFCHSLMGLLRPIYWEAAGALPHSPTSIVMLAAPPPLKIIYLREDDVERRTPVTFFL